VTRLLLDEHLSPNIARELRARNHDVVAALEAGLVGLDDSRLLSWAIGQGRAVVTANVVDFRMLHANQLTMSAGHFGIILVPTGKYCLQKDRLGPLVVALHHLLRDHPSEQDLSDIEYFL
jgi:Domain of unknown function (DUF5615)